LKATVTPTAIRSIDNSEKEYAVFDLQGRKVGTTKSSLKSGIYIINNKKVVLK